MVASIGGNGKGNLLGNLNQSNQEKENLFNQISSGKRINKANDDAAGLAIVAALEANVAQLEQATRNNQDAVSAINVAEGAASQVTEITSRMQELAMQSANGTYSDEQRAVNAQEFNALRDEISRITSTTEFNGKKLLGGDDLVAQVGTDSGADSQISVQGVNLASKLSGLSSLDISSQAGAQASLQALQDVNSQIASSRGELGAVTSRLQAAEANAASSAINSEEAAARIRDVDVADSTAKLTAANIRSQVGVALQAHQNLTTSNVLDLLR